MYWIKLTVAICLVSGRMSMLIALTTCFSLFYVDFSFSVHYGMCKMLCLFSFAVGCFSVAQATEVMAAWFNMWDYELTSDQVNALTCYDEGNVVTLTDMSLGGAAHFTYSQSFECGMYSMFLAMNSKD